MVNSESTELIQKSNWLIVNRSMWSIIQRWKTILPELTITILLLKNSLVFFHSKICVKWYFHFFMSKLCFNNPELWKQSWSVCYVIKFKKKQKVFNLWQCFRIVDLKAEAAVTLSQRWINYHPGKLSDDEPTIWKMTLLLTFPETHSVMF